MTAIINSYNKKPYIITKKSKNEKVEEDGLLVSWIGWVWNIGENRFVTSKGMASSIRSRSRVLSLLKAIMETHSRNRPLTRLSKISDNYYEGYEGAEKMIEWRIEERNFPEEVIISRPIFFAGRPTMNNTVYEPEGIILDL